MQKYLSEYLRDKYLVFWPYLGNCSGWARNTFFFPISSNEIYGQSHLTIHKDAPVYTETHMLQNCKNKKNETENSN